MRLVRRLRASWLIGRGNTACNRGDHAAAAASYEHALAAAKDEPQARFLARLMLADEYTEAGRAHDAVPLLLGIIAATRVDARSLLQSMAKTIGGDNAGEYCYQVGTNGIRASQARIEALSSLADAQTALGDPAAEVAALWDLAIAAREVGDADARATALLRAGQVQKRFGDDKEAVGTLQALLREAEAQAAVLTRARALLDLASCHWSLGERDVAWSEMQEARTLFERAGDAFGQASVRYRIAQAHEACGDMTAARQNAHLSARFAREAEIPDVEVQITELFAALGLEPDKSETPT